MALTAFILISKRAEYIFYTVKQEGKNYLLQMLFVWKLYRNLLIFIEKTIKISKLRYSEYIQSKFQAQTRAVSLQKMNLTALTI